MLLVVDARTSGARRLATVELATEQVYGWNPCTGEAAAGFPECIQGVLGASVQLSLSPGDGVLVRLTMWRKAGGKAGRKEAVRRRASSRTSAMRALF